MSNKNPPVRKVHAKTTPTEALEGKGIGKKHF